MVNNARASRIFDAQNFIFYKFFWFKKLYCKFYYILYTYLDKFQGNFWSFFSSRGLLFQDVKILEIDVTWCPFFIKNKVFKIMWKAKNNWKGKALLIFFVKHKVRKRGYCRFMRKFLIFVKVVIGLSLKKLFLLNNVIV